MSFKQVMVSVEDDEDGTLEWDVVFDGHAYIVVLNEHGEFECLSCSPGVDDMDTPTMVRCLIAHEISLVCHDGRTAYAVSEARSTLSYNLSKIEPH
jgi:hypothetical protein